MNAMNSGISTELVESRRLIQATLYKDDGAHTVFNVQAPMAGNAQIVRDFDALMNCLAPGLAVNSLQVDYQVFGCFEVSGVHALEWDGETIARLVRDAEALMRGLIFGTEDLRYGLNCKFAPEGGVPQCVEVFSSTVLTLAAASSSGADCELRIDCPDEFWRSNPQGAVEEIGAFLEYAGERALANSGTLEPGVAVYDAQREAYYPVNGGHTFGYSMFSVAAIAGGELPRPEELRDVLAAFQAAWEEHMPGLTTE